MHLCLFEDNSSTNFLPLTYFRPVYDLRCGMLSLRERILSHFPMLPVTLHARTYLADYLIEQHPGVPVNKFISGTYLMVNGRCIMTRQLATLLKKQSPDIVFTSRGEIVAARVSSDVLSTRKVGGAAFEDEAAGLLEPSVFGGLPTVEVSAQLVSYPWDLVYANESELASDFELLIRQRAGAGKRHIHPSAVLVKKKNIHIGKNATIGPGAVLDASEGPIYIDREVRIFPTAVIEGPCYVGEGSLIKIGAKVYGNTSVGAFCKIGGEVEHSIFHSHANKQHDGFVGHSYIGSWANLGAGTTTSNLKNTYGNVKVSIGGSLIDSEKMFVGLIAGDHAKTGINSTLDTGTVIGPSSNVFGSAIHPKFIPAFSWGDAQRMETYSVDKALDVAVKVMSRRNVTASPAYKELFRYVFLLTNHERSRFRA
ncbi:MAG: GlmU family protein [Ignavibacteriae bacterium]|nr:GlmU family protein [Ignavibacteriota bacterium]